MNTKELIELNNEKRNLLTEENEAYYIDILLYIRLQLELSEHYSEEVLMDILDHLLDGQKNGKSAEDIFGSKPIDYAKTIITELPKEKKRNVSIFLAGIATSMLGLILMIRGSLLGVFSLFTTVNETIPVGMTFIISTFLIIYIIAIVAFFLKRIRYSLIQQTSYLKDSLYAGTFAALGMGILIMIIYLLPAWGPVIEFPWMLSLISGAIIWMAVYIIKKKRHASY